MEIAILLSEIVILLAGVFVYNQIKELPKQIHAESLKHLEHELSKRLEEFKTSLSKDLELLKISHSELQIHKAEEFTNFTKYFVELLHNKEKIRNLQSNPKFAAEFTQKV